MIYRGSSVSPRELNRSLSVVAGMGCGPKLAMDQLCGGLLRVCADRHTEKSTYFCQLLSEPPMRKVGTHGGMEEEEKAVGVGGVGMAPSRGRRPRLHTSGLGRYWR